MGQSTEKYCDALRSVGLKATKSRLQVLEALAEMGGHCSADQVHKFLTNNGLTVPRGTVFKVVGDLCEHGVLMVTDVGPGRTLYEYAECWHHHFVCRVCKTIIDVPCFVGEKPCFLPDIDLPATIDEAQVIFRGICHGCRDSAKS